MGEPQSGHLQRGALGEVKLYGIRHHGPGSARSLLAALKAEPPELLLVEGPPEATPRPELFTNFEVELPIAVLHYVGANPAKIFHSPYSLFSPEWQAIGYAYEHGIPVSLIDLPLRHQLAMVAVDEDSRPQVDQSGERLDPLAELAAVAGFEDPELWWEQLIEQRPADGTIFPALIEAMRALRTSVNASPSVIEQCREAWMRREIRLAAGARAAQQIAVVCGAWHLPVLDPADPALPDELADERLLSQLPQVDVHSCWVPWSERELARFAGYGAGLQAPAWSRHLWESSGRDCTQRWISTASTLLRARGTDIPTAGLIEAVRLATTLAVLRALPRPGLAELIESLVAVICNGDDRLLAPVKQELVTGNRVGRIPANLATPPLFADWHRLCRELRLESETVERIIQLDLRQPLDLRRSQFLHRLDLLGVGWGTNLTDDRVESFRETWRLEWTSRVPPELNRGGIYGPTVESAAAGFVSRQLDQCDEDHTSQTRLAELIDLFGRTLQAGIGARRIEPGAQRIDQLIAERLDRLSVDQVSLLMLMRSFPALVRLERYGLVHQFDLPPNSGCIGHIVDRLISRISIGLSSLPGVVTREEPESTASLLEAVDRAMSLVGRADRAAAWPLALRSLLNRGSSAGRIAGCAALLLWQAGELSAAELSRVTARTLSSSIAATEAAGWIDGIVRPAGTIITRDRELFRVLSQWLTRLEEQHFIQLLPLLRRTFARLPTPARREIELMISAETARPDRPTSFPPAATIDHERAEMIVPVLTRLLGLEMGMEGYD